jgi:ABC-type glycerol-3-phosphate transport system permease component
MQERMAVAAITRRRSERMKQMQPAAAGGDDKAERALELMQQLGELPLLIAFLCFRRQIVEGIANTGLKG